MIRNGNKTHSMEEIILSDIIGLLQRTGSIEALDPDQDFYDAGITSVMTLPLMMDMEDMFAIVVPDQEFVQARTARALAKLVQQLKQGGE